MFGFSRLKDAKQKEFQAKLQEAALKIIEALNTDIDYLMFFEGKRESSIFWPTHTLCATSLACLMPSPSLWFRRNCA
jgi:hypothetical protein